MVDQISHFEEQHEQLRERECALRNWKNDEKDREKRDLEIGIEQQAEEKRAREQVQARLQEEHEVVKETFERLRTINENIREEIDLLLSAKQSAVHQLQTIQDEATINLHHSLAKKKAERVEKLSQQAKQNRQERMIQQQYLTAPR